MTSLIAAMILSAALYAQPIDNAHTYAHQIFREYAASHHAQGKQELFRFTYQAQSFSVTKEGLLTLDDISKEQALELMIASELLRQMNSSGDSLKAVPADVKQRIAGCDQTYWSQGDPNVSLDCANLAATLADAYYAEHKAAF